MRSGGKWWLSDCQRDPTGSSSAPYRKHKLEPFQDLRIHLKIQSGSHSLIEGKDPILTCQCQRARRSSLRHSRPISHHVTNDYPKNLCSLLFAGRVASTRWSTIRTDTTLLTLFAPYGAPETVYQASRSPFLRRSGKASLNISIDLSPCQVNSFTLRCRVTGYASQKISRYSRSTRAATLRVAI
jgi:hypothetical protein